MCVYDRIFAAPMEQANKQLSSISGLKNCLFKIDEDSVVPYHHFLIAQITTETTQELETLASLTMRNATESIILPSVIPPLGERLYYYAYPHLLKYLKRLAQRIGGITVCYRRTEYWSAHGIEIEAWLFDYGKGSNLHDCVFYEEEQQGERGGYYWQGVNPTITRRLVSGAPVGSVKKPIYTPLMRLISSFHEVYEWSKRVNWDENRLEI